jgi:YegS/Rv2252/BmrU family lipid kinase
MKNIVIINPIAGAGRIKKWLAANLSIIEKHCGPLDLKFTTKPGDASGFARKAVENRIKKLIVVGGDGTFNEVINGFFDENGNCSKETALLPLAVGTGADFVRSIGGNGDLLTSLKSSEQFIDIGRAKYINAEGKNELGYFLNISSFGASGLIVNKVNHSSKRFGGKISFFLGTLRGLSQYRKKNIRLKVDQHFDEKLEINSVVIANGRYFGGSMMIAPEAFIDDGLFDIIIIKPAGLMTFLRYGLNIYQGTHLKRPEFQLLKGKNIEVIPLETGPVLIEADGEQPGKLPVQYDILPGVLRLIAPWEKAEAIQ